MKTRIIQTRFWDDDFINNSHYATRYIYMHLLTSAYINICGMFQLTVNKIMFETNLPPELFELAKKELEEAKKVFFFKGWVFVVNARRNNRYEVSEDNRKAANKELERVPADVFSYFQDILNSSDSSTVASTNKSETINNKQESIIEELDSSVNSTVPETKKPIIRTECEEFIEIFNTLRSTKYKATEGVIKLFKYWRDNFNQEEILQATKNIPLHNWLKNIEYTPTIFLRTNKDWIDQCLNLKPAKGGVQQNGSVKPEEGKYDGLKVTIVETGA